ncbi:MAG: hypothetical protein JSS07_04460 [Proteobacteria bacterium]|nr:hypothetical protein [Pseudomonadota bacterium]
MIQHNIVWATLFSRIGGDGKAWRIVRFKVRRLLYDEIARLSEFPNYKGTRILGYCLNILGMERGSDKKKNENYALAKAVQSWAKKHFFTMWQKNSDVAESTLIGGLSFDQQNKKLIRTWAKGLSREAPQSILDLE